MAHAWLLPVALAALALSACERHGRMYAGKDGDYYVPPGGLPERVDGAKLVALRRAPMIDKTLTIAQDLGQDGITHFDAYVSGKVRMEGAVRKIHLELYLAPRDGSAPPPAAQEAFVDALANSQAATDAIVLYFHDHSGMKAADPEVIPLASLNGVERSAGGPGRPPAYVIDILESWSPPLDGDIADVTLGWRNKIVVTGNDLSRWSQPPPAAQGRPAATNGM